MANLLNQIVSSEGELNNLLGPYESSFVGYVYGMSFSEALILTNDAWKHKVNGIPHNSLASSSDGSLMYSHEERKF